MSLLIHIIVTYIKENITKLQKLYSRLYNLCTVDLSPVRTIFIERPELYSEVATGGVL